MIGIHPYKIIGYLDWSSSREIHEFVYAYTRIGVPVYVEMNKGILSSSSHVFPIKMIVPIKQYFRVYIQNLSFFNVV